jgi:L-alanine-DL-glutamate epimerase-like enolase superfamily enzyme
LLHPHPHHAGNTEPVRIRSAQAFGLSLPLAKPVLMAGVRLDKSQTLIVRLESENGCVGWGEAIAAPSHGGATLPEMHQAWDSVLSPGLKGSDALGLGALSQALAVDLPSGQSAATAVDMALHDLVGQHLGVPVHVLLGGKRRSAVAALWLIGTGTRDTDLAEAERRFSEGYRFFKLKVGVRAVEEEVELALALRERLGPELRLCADANMGMTADQAIRYAQGVLLARLEFFEQPLHKDDLVGLKRLLAADLIPVGLDESLTSMAALLSHVALGTHGGSLKTLKLGGMSGVVAAAQVCAAHRQHINLAGKIAETGIGSAALIHLAGVVPNMDWGVSPSHSYLAQDIVRQPVTPLHGVYQVPSRPGLGVEVDESLLERYQIS